ncbi:MAG: glycosyltransferase [Bdellovibrionales bacterium]|nr:glycosyltransferase [Bdellovibrionales bacterium]
MDSLVEDLENEKKKLKLWIEGLREQVASQKSELRHLRRRVRDLETIPDSLAFRLGLACVLAVKSPGGFLKFPLRIGHLLGLGFQHISRLALRMVFPASFPYTRAELAKKLKAALDAESYEGLVTELSRLAGSAATQEEALAPVAFQFLMELDPKKSLEYARVALSSSVDDVQLLEGLAGLRNLARAEESLELVSSVDQLLSDFDLLRFSPEQLQTPEFQALLSEGLIRERARVQPDGKIARFVPSGYTLRRLRYEATYVSADSAETMLNQLREFAELPEESFASIGFKAFSVPAPERALKFAERYLELCPEDMTFYRKLAQFYFRQGMLRKPGEMFKRLEERRGEFSASGMIQGQISLLENGFSLPETTKRTPYEPASETSAFYLLHNSLPFASGGYATRTHGLLTSLRRIGRDIQAVSRLGYPTDRDDRFSLADVVDHEIDGVPYLRLPSESRGYGRIPLNSYLAAYGEAVHSKALQERPALVHAASNFMNGMAASYAARKLGIPSVYEVRGLWEVTRMSRQPSWQASEIYQMQVRMERDACLAANAVVTITEALKREMVSRGVPESKITVVPNGVDPSRFVAIEPDLELADQLGVRGKVVLGYIGSVVDYEGLELLLEASNILRAEKVPFAVVIVGDGAALEALKSKTIELGLYEIVQFTGRVPHHDVERYYSLIDITPYPRLPLPVCEMVSPMKPFESMAMKKTVVASDVAALAEIVQDGKTGLLHKKGSAQDLADKLKTAIENEGLRHALGENARTWVVEERDWVILARRLASVHDSVLEHPQALCVNA